MTRAHATADTLRDGRYRVLRTLGVGGQGSVVLARDTASGREVAIKRIDLHGGSGWKPLDRFDQECSALRRLDHPGIPRFVDRFEQGTSFFLVMEYVEGRCLADPAVTLDERDVRRILEETGAILAYLHGLRPPVVHRDVKPGNLVLRPNGHVALVDFGLVRDAMTFGASTSLGVGTIGFMAPEQLEGRPIPQSDLYGLGMTALTLLTRTAPGDLPRRGARIDVARLGLATDLAAVIERMVERDPERRATNVASLFQAAPVAPEANPFAHGPREVAGASPRRSPLAFPVGVATLLAAGLGAHALIDYLREARPEPAPIAASAPAPSATEAAQAPTAAPTPPPIIEAPAPAPEPSPCAAVLARIGDSTRADGGALPPLGDDGPIVDRTRRHALDPTDLARTRSQAPCVTDAPTRDAWWAAFVRSAARSPRAWAAASEVSDDLRTALTGPERLTTDCALALRRRADEVATATIRAATTPSDLDAAAPLCELARALAGGSGPGCAGVEKKRDALERAARTAEERCAVGAKAREECRFDCLMRYDLFDARSTACETACDARWLVAGCRP